MYYHPQDPGEIGTYCIIQGEFNPLDLPICCEKQPDDVVLDIFISPKCLPDYAQLPVNVFGISPFYFVIGFAGLLLSSILRKK